MPDTQSVFKKGLLIEGLITCMKERSDPEPEPKTPDCVEVCVRHGYRFPSTLKMKSNPPLSFYHP